MSSDPNQFHDGSNRDVSDQGLVSELVMHKLVQTEIDGEQFWKKLSLKIEKLKGTLEQVDLNDNVSIERGTEFLTPVAKIQIGFLAATILVSVLFAMLFLALKNPTASSIDQRSFSSPVEPNSRDGVLVKSSVLSEVDAEARMTSEQIQEDQSIAPFAAETLLAEACRSLAISASESAAQMAARRSIVDSKPKPGKKIIGADDRLDMTLEIEFPKSSTRDK